MSQPENEILLGLFLEHNIPSKSKADLEKSLKTFVELMLKNDCAGEKPTKRHLKDRNIQNYFNDFWRPITDNEGKAMPHKRDQEGVMIRDANGESEVNDDIIERQEQAAGGAGKQSYCLNLTKLDEVCSALTKRWTMV